MSMIEEYHGPSPAPLRLQMVRGDTFKRKLFQVVDQVDGVTPVSLSEYTFIWEIRTTPFESDEDIPLLRVDMEHLFFGTSPEGLDAGVADDELHGEIPDTLTKIDPGTWWHGIRAIDPNGHIELLFQDKIKVVADVPRKTEVVE